MVFSCLFHNVFGCDCKCTDRMICRSCDVEKLVKNLGKEKTAKKEENTQQVAVFQDLEEKMKAALGTKVSINRKNDQKGKIEIEYYSMDELERLMEILMK